MKDKLLSKINSQIKTPAYLFNRDEFKERASRTKEIIGSDVNLCYSIKANPFLLFSLPEEFSAVEVCSPGELAICIKLGIDPKMIIYSGLNKGREDIDMALEYGVSLLTAESRLHLDMINHCASRRDLRADVLVRASAGSQFGIDRKDLFNVLSCCDSYPHIEFAGLHFFTGTQKRKSKEILKELDFLERYISELRETSELSLPRIEYGTGLPSFLFCDSDNTSVQGAIDNEYKMLAEIAPALARLSKQAALTIEMGRFFASSCGYYFTKVVDAKANDGLDYAIVEGGSHQIRYFGQMQGMQLPFISHIRGALCSDEASDNTEKRWTICGSLCTTADVLARNAALTDLKIGDALVFHQAGAYSLYECMSLFLSRDLPGIYMLDKDNLFLLRDRIESNSFNLADTKSSPIVL